MPATAEGAVDIETVCSNPQGLHAFPQQDRNVLLLLHACFVFPSEREVGHRRVVGEALEIERLGLSQLLPPSTLVPELITVADADQCYLLVESGEIPL